MKNLISTIIAVSLFLPVLAQKTPPIKDKDSKKTDIGKHTPKVAGKKKVKLDDDSTKVEIKMDKPLDIYFDSLNLTKRQIEQIAGIDEFMSKRQGMSRAQFKMTKEQIASEEKQNLEIRNNKIHAILTTKQIKEIYLLQNGKLKVGLSVDEVIAKMQLKPSQKEEINKLKDNFKTQIEEINKIEDEIERLKLIKIIEQQKEKNYKEVLNIKEREYFDGIKSGKIEVLTDEEQKDMEEKASGSNKKG